MHTLLEGLWGIAYIMAVSLFWGFAWVRFSEIWFLCFAGGGKRNAPHAFWYDNEVRPLMDEDERMQSLSDVAHARLRHRAIQRARMAAQT